jgi:hypothetical protein
MLPFHKLHLCYKTNTACVVRVDKKQLLRSPPHQNSNPNPSHAETKNQQDPIHLALTNFNASYANDVVAESSLLALEMALAVSR